MKKHISQLLALLLVSTLLCACEPQSNPLRATLTYSASNGDTGVLPAFEAYDSKSAIYRATKAPLVITFISRYNPEPVVDYEFYCPKCKKKEVGKLFPPQSHLCVCNCEQEQNTTLGGVQAYVIKACFSTEALAETMPQYESAESYTYFNTEPTETEFIYEATEENVTKDSSNETISSTDETVSTEETLSTETAEESTEETTSATTGY